MMSRNENEPSAKDLTEIFSIALVSFIGILMTTAVTVNFPMMVRYFHTSLSNVQWFSTGAMIVSAVTMICSAYLDRRFNDRTVFLMATVNLLLSLIICALAKNFYLFLFGRLLDGFSIGICTPLMFNVIPKLVPRSKIGFYMATGATVVAVGPSLGPTYGGLVNAELNWRMIFIIVIPVTAFLMILGLITITNHVPVRSHLSFDWLGLALIILAFGSIAVGLNSLSQISVITGLTFLIGIVAIISFLKHGAHTKRAALNVKIFKIHQFSFAVGAYFLIQLTNIGLSGLLIPNFSQVALGVTSLISGLILLPGNLLRIICMPLGGALLDKLGSKLPIYIGLSLMVLYFAVMSIMAKDLTITEIWIAYLVYNVGLAMSFSNVLTSGLERLSAEQKGDGNAIFNAVQIYGGAVGTCILSLIISVVGQHIVTLSRAIAMRNGGQWCFTFLLMIVLVAIGSIHLSFKSNTK